MEQFIVSARKYRPQVFEDVVGQQAITKTLENAIKNNHLAQALLFTGPRGVGKTTCARILAKRINQEHLDKINPDEDFAFNIFELDAASNNSVDDIRALTEQVRIPPQTGHYKVYIIDEVHMLSTNAFNAFLKTLEEPPAHAIFILATTEKHKIIPTILSRCQIFDFKRISVIDIKNYLKKIAKEQQIETEDDALHIIAQKADGALRDALSIFDRILSFSDDKITRLNVIENLNVLDYEVYFDITNLIIQHQIPKLLLAFNNILSKGIEGHHFINGLASHFRDLLVAKDKTTIELLEVGTRAKERYLEQCEKCEVSFLLKAINLCNTCDLNYKISKNQRLLVELCLMKLASIDFNPELLGEKKKSENNIIPAFYFNNESITKQTTRTPIQTAESSLRYQIKKSESNKAKQNILQQKTKPKRVKLKLNSTSERHISALSIKSIEEKVKQKKDLVQEENNKNLPNNKFTESQFLEVWQNCINNLHQANEKLLVSVLKINTPKINGENIELTLPNEIMASSFKKGKLKLLNCIRAALKNHKIDINIIVNESTTKEYIYTPQERYEALKKKNSNIALLRKAFKLDL